MVFNIEQIFWQNNITQHALLLLIKSELMKQKLRCLRILHLHYKKQKCIVAPSANNSHVKMASLLPMSQQTLNF